MSEKLTGVVTKSTGSWYLVRIGTDIIQCRVKGKIKLDDLKLTNPIAVGDQVIIEMEPKEDVASIVTILPRKNYIVRQSPRKKHLLHFMASNVDQVLLIVTLKNPNLKLGFIDRFLLMTEPYSIPVVIVFNKADIYNAVSYTHLDVYKRQAWCRSPPRRARSIARRIRGRQQSLEEERGELVPPLHCSANVCGTRRSPRRPIRSAKTS